MNRHFSGVFYWRVDWGLIDVVKKYYKKILICGGWGIWFSVYIFFNRNMDILRRWIYNGIHKTKKVILTI
jgi:hypothetical protein